MSITIFIMYSIGCRNKLHYGPSQGNDILGEYKRNREAG